MASMLLVLCGLLLSPRGVLGQETCANLNGTTMMLQTKTSIVQVSDGSIGVQGNGIVGQHCNGCTMNAAFAVDGNSGTRQGAHGGWWKGDLGTTKLLTKVTIDWEACQCRAEGSVLLEVWTDGSGWSRFGKSSGAGGFFSWGGHTTRTYTGSKPARWVRVRIQGSASTNWWSIWELTVATSPLALPSCPASQQISTGMWLPSGIPGRTECSYPASNSFSKVLSTQCGNMCEIAKRTLLASRQENTKVPAGIAARIISRMTQVAGIYFKNPNLERDMTVTANVFDLVDAGLASFVGGENLRGMMKVEGLENDWGRFKSRVKGWMHNPAAHKLKLGKTLAMGALDVAAAFAGPIGGALSLAGAVFSFWHTDNTPKLMERLAEEILSEVATMIAKSTYVEQMKRVQGYLEAFTEEVEYNLRAVQQLSMSREEHAGMTQFLLLNALQGDMATTRNEWLPFRYENACSDLSCGSTCGKLKSMLAHSVPILAALHLSLLDQMVIAISAQSAVAYEVRKKFYMHAYEYYKYVDRFWIGLRGQPGDKIKVCHEGGYSGMLKLSDALDGWNHPSLKFNLFKLLQQGKQAGFLHSSLDIQPSLLAEDASLLEVNRSTSVHEAHFAATMVPLSFEKPPVIREPRSDLEAEFHTICGPGLACMRSEITKDQMASFRALASKARERVA